MAGPAGLSDDAAYTAQATAHLAPACTAHVMMVLDAMIVSVAVPFRRTIATAQHYASVPGQENRVTRQP